MLNWSQPVVINRLFSLYLRELLDYSIKQDFAHDGIVGFYSIVFQSLLMIAFILLILQNPSINGHKQQHLCMRGFKEDVKMHSTVRCIPAYKTSNKTTM